MEELRTQHLGTLRKPGAHPVFPELRGAVEKVLAAVEAEAEASEGVGRSRIRAAASAKPS